MRFVGTAFCFLLSVIMAGSAAAQDLPPQIQVAGKALYLNGSGVRKVTIFAIRAYVAELYLEHRSYNAEQILADPGMKKLAIVFIRDVSAGRLFDGLEEGLEDNVPDYERFAPELERVRGLISDVAEGERLEIVFAGDRAAFIDQRGVKTEIEAPGFAEALLSIWIGPEPADDDLKQGLLGVRP